MGYRCLISPWKNEFTDIIGSTERELFISSPFVNFEGVKILSEAVNKKKSVHVSVITNFSAQNIVNGVTEPAALLELYERFSSVKISSLGRLHAKVYLIDNSMGIITSANLTRGGLVNNFEYGIVIDDKDMIYAIKSDMLQYYSLGNVFDKEFLEKINQQSNEMFEIRKKAEKTDAAQLLKKSQESLGIELLRNRVKGGRTINEIFTETILYILSKKGSLSTQAMHSLIQVAHPDICDDSIDRVINGQNFGKKWKHSVRNAQQSLKKNRQIYLKDGKWYLGN